jgi:hypothetical protein
MSSGLMSLGMLVSSINGLMDTINDPDATPWERFGAILTSVSMIATSLGGTFKGLKATISLLQLTQDKETISKMANAAATHLQEKNSILV